MDIQELAVRAGTELRSWDPEPVDFVEPRRRSTPTLIVAAAAASLVAVIAFGITGTPERPSSVASAPTAPGNANRSATVDATCVINANAGDQMMQLSAEQSNYLSNLKHHGDLEYRATIGEESVEVSLKFSFEVGSLNQADAMARAALATIAKDPVGSTLGCESPVPAAWGR